MIKEDIVLTSSNESVDDIFSEADKIMESQTIPTKSIKAKSIKNKIKVFIITFCIILVSFIVIGAISLMKGASAVLPSIKESIATQTQSIKTNLEKIDEDKLTPEEYFQKKTLDLITKEDIDRAIGGIGDVIKLSTNKKDFTKLIPQDKQEEYDRLLQEYEEVKNDPQKFKELKEKDKKKEK